MTSNYLIGHAAERAAKAELERQGFLVYKAVHTRFQHEDIFRLFDLIAINKHKVRLVQVKAGGLTNFTRNAIKSFEVPENVSKELWKKNKFKRKNKWTIECW